MLAWMEETLPWGSVLVSAVLIGVAFLFVWGDEWIAALTRERTPAVPRRAVDYARLAELEHELMPQESWTPEAHTDDVCGDCRWSVFSWPPTEAEYPPCGCTDGPWVTHTYSDDMVGPHKPVRLFSCPRGHQPGGPVAAPGPFLEVRGPLTANEAREIARRFKEAHARPALLINTPGLMQIVPRHAVDYDEYEVVGGTGRVVDTYRHPWEGSNLQPPE